MKPAIFSALVLLAPATALAHPGHGVQAPTSLGHVLVEHGWLAALIAFAVIAGGLQVRRTLRARGDRR
jgi:hypothetical protein